MAEKKENMVYPIISNWELVWNCEEGNTKITGETETGDTINGLITSEKGNIVTLEDGKQYQILPEKKPC